MNETIRQMILAQCKDGESRVWSPKSGFTLNYDYGRTVSYGVDPKGFPFVIQRTQHNTFKMVCKSRLGVQPSEHIIKLS